MATATYDFKVNASIDKVWEAISEGSEYETWNPFIVKVNGKMEPGAEVEMTCVTDSGKTLRGPAQVVANEPHSRIAWSLNSPISGFRSWSVEMQVSENGDGTNVTVNTNLGGLAQMIMGPKMDEIGAGFNRMADAMSKRVGQQQQRMAA